MRSVKAMSRGARINSPLLFRSQFDLTLVCTILPADILPVHVMKDMMKTHIVFAFLKITYNAHTDCSFCLDEDVNMVDFSHVAIFT